MSGYFTRSGYDCKYLSEAEKQSVAPGNYKLSNNQWNNKNSCASRNGPRADRVPATGEYNCSYTTRTQIESALTNRGRPDCRKCAISVDQKNTITDQYNCGSVSFCPDKTDFTYSRLDLPRDQFRGLSTFNLQMDYPLINPVNWTFNGNNTCGEENKDSANLRFGCNTSLDAKDSYTKRFRSC